MQSGYFAIFSCCLVFLTNIGCNHNTKVMAVSGTVTYDGQPVSGAIVTLVPNGGGGKPTQAGVMDGKFAISRKFGVSSGKYMITVEEAPIEGGMISDLEDSPTKHVVSKPRFGFQTYSMNHDFPSGTKETTLSIVIPKKH